jgi:hypothetical protein
MILLLFCLVCYYPTAPLMLHQILKIARHLNAFENDTLLRQVVVHMKDKYFKYWRDIPILYAFAFILDPRAKMRGFHKALPRLSTFTGTDYSRLPQDVRKGLTKLYQIYDTKFGDVRLRVHESSSTTEGKNKSAWDDIYMVMMILVVVGDLVLVVMLHLILPGLLLLSLSCLHTLIVILSINLMTVSAFWVGGMGINLLTLFYLY